MLISIIISLIPCCTISTECSLLPSDPCGPPNNRVLSTLFHVEAGYVVHTFWRVSQPIERILGPCARVGPTARLRGVSRRPWYLSLCALRTPHGLWMIRCIQRIIGTHQVLHHHQCRSLTIAHSSRRLQATLSPTQICFVSCHNESTKPHQEE